MAFKWDMRVTELSTNIIPVVWLLSPNRWSSPLNNAARVALPVITQQISSTAVCCCQDVVWIYPYTRMTWHVQAFVFMDVVSSLNWPLHIRRASCEADSAAWSRRRYDYPMSYALCWWFCEGSCRKSSTFMGCATISQLPRKECSPYILVLKMCHVYGKRLA